MKRLLLMLSTIAALLAVAGCSGNDGDTGPAGPAGEDATPAPIHVLVIGSDSDGSLTSRVYALYGEGNVHRDTEIDIFNAQTTAPVLADLTGHDVVLYYTNVSTTVGTETGDALADYVDAGGKVLFMQGAFSSGFEIAGRFMTAGYSPVSASAGTGDANDRAFDTSAMALPPHEIFHGVNIAAFTSAGLSAVSAGTPTVGAVVMATWTNGDNAILTNADESVIAINLFPQVDEPATARLMGNVLHYLAGAF